MMMLRYTGLFCAVALFSSAHASGSSEDSGSMAPDDALFKRGRWGKGKGKITDPDMFRAGNKAFRVMEGGERTSRAAFRRQAESMPPMYREGSASVSSLSASNSAPFPGRMGQYARDDAPTYDMSNGSNSSSLSASNSAPFPGRMGQYARDDAPTYDMSNGSNSSSLSASNSAPFPGRMGQYARDDAPTYDMSSTGSDASSLSEGSAGITILHPAEDAEKTYNTPKKSAKKSVKKSIRARVHALQMFCDDKDAFKLIADSEPTSGITELLARQGKLEGDLQLFPKRTAEIEKQLDSVDAKIQSLRGNGNYLRRRLTGLAARFERHLRQ